MENKIQSDLKINIEELFSRYEFIISGHFGFNRFPEGIGSASDHVSIIQKLKSKCYLGIKKVERAGITFDTVKMISKIINPFVKYIKKAFGIQLDIECSGSLREFFITLGETDIPIQLVKKY